MPTNRTARQIIDEVRRLAAEQPDFVYERPMVEDEHGRWVESSRCQYLHADGPGCIIGHAMAGIGVSVPVTCEGKGVRDVLRFFGIDFTVDEGLFLATVQRAQDRGERWGYAIGEADAELEEASTKGYAALVALGYEG